MVVGLLALSLLAPASAATVEARLERGGVVLAQGAASVDRSGPVFVLTPPAPLPPVVVSLLGRSGTYVLVELSDADPASPHLGDRWTSLAKADVDAELAPRWLGREDGVTVHVRVTGELPEARADDGWHVSRFVPRAGRFGAEWLAGSTLASAWRTAWCSDGARLHVLPMRTVPGAAITLAVPPRSSAVARIECRMLNDVGDWVDTVWWTLDEAPSAP